MLDNKCACCDNDAPIENQSPGNEPTQNKEISVFNLFRSGIISLILLLIALAFDYLFDIQWFSGWIRVCWYILAYIPVGYPVLKDAWKSIKNGNFFSEFFLMGIATIGAFAIGEFSEAVAVMLFYSIGEGFQSLAVYRSKANIKSLLDQRPDLATIIVEGVPRLVSAKTICIGDIIQLKPGEKLALDGKIISDFGIFNTSALTGESKPDKKYFKEEVLAGMINLTSVVKVEITAKYQDSKLSKILELVQKASSQKAPTELFISKFARIYTPIVVFLAISITLLPALFVDDYVFQQWLYRALIFLVVSCPCALVISIPLGYFGGVGAASKHGVLVKGGNFLDVLASLNHIVLDKTGTLTKGIFKIRDIIFQPSSNTKEILTYVNAIESKSNHPIATAIREHLGEPDHLIQIDEMEEIPGMGLKGVVSGHQILVGNFKLLDKYGITYTKDPSIVYSTIAVAYNQQYVGYITVADELKDDSYLMIQDLLRLGVEVTILSGDREAVVGAVANELKVENYFGDLLPQDKFNKFKEIKNYNEVVGFVGDGVNDAPVIALSDVGIAMGGLGSDATIESADVVIQDDKLIKIPMAIHIGKFTKKIVWQNIGLAFGVKVIVLILGALGVANMWEAVFADVGVALLAILNAVRIQRMNFNTRVNSLKI